MTRWCHAPNWHILFVIAKNYANRKIMRSDNSGHIVVSYFKCNISLSCVIVCWKCVAKQKVIWPHTYDSAYDTALTHLTKCNKNILIFFAVHQINFPIRTQLSCHINVWQSHADMTSHWHTFWKAGGLICLKSPMICTNHSQTQPLFGANKCELRQCAICL